MVYKVGDIVRVVNIAEEEHRDVLGKIGKIVDVDPDWVFPYEIEFLDGVIYSKDLFAENEIVLHVGSLDNHMSIKLDEHEIFDDGNPLVLDVVSLLIKELKEQHNNSTSLNSHMNVINAISRLEEARFWIMEIENRKNKKRD